MLTLTAYAQRITVSGSVTDAEDNPLIGAAVAVVGTTNGVVTDLNGRYSIQVDKTARLHFSYVGYQEQTVSVNGRSTINVKLQEGETLDEVVVIGYGAVKKSHLTGAVSSMSGKEMQAAVARDAASALQGRITGVTVSNNNGQPGSGMTINIRGISSLQSTTPLYIIDGVYGDINMVDPADIQSLEVLKDASAAAIYGSRAANGVVLITTKGGHKEMPARVEVNAYAGVQNVAKKLDIMDANQYRDFCKLYNINQKVSDVTGWNGGAGTNWQDEVFRQALVSKASVNVSGGSKTATYNVSASYLKQDGIMLTTGYEAWNIRAKNTFSFFNNHVRLGSTFLMKFWDKDYDSFSTTSLVQTVPMQQVYDYENPHRGHWGMTPEWAKAAGNPVGSLEANDSQKHGMDILLNGYAEVDLGLKGLKYKLNVGINKYNRRNYTFLVPYYFSNADQESESKLTEGSDWENDWLIENTLHYDNTFGKHTVNVVAGYSAQRNSGRGINAASRRMAESTSVIGAGRPGTFSAGGSAWANSMVSMFGRAMYSYDDRYLASVSVRHDGSSKFADGHKWGTFPSASIGWNIMNEDFFEDLKSTFNEVKLRASYGVLGNLNGIGNYATQATVYSGLNGTFNSSLSAGGINGYSWSSPLETTWEQTKTTDIGLDLGLWNNKLTLSFDYYIQKTQDMLLSVPQPGSFGLSGDPTMNAGDIENRGFEIALNHRNTIGEVYYHAGANLSFLKNELVAVNCDRKEWGGYDPHGGGTVTYAKPGYPIGGFWLVKTDGIFQDQKEIDSYVNKNGQKVQPDAQPGDLKFVDYDGNGEISSVADKQYCGSAMPKVSLGLTMGAEWRGIDLNLFFDGQFGHKIYNALPYYTVKREGIGNYLANMADSWRQDNKNTDIPRYIGPTDVQGSNTDNNGTTWAVTDRWLEKGDFFRLKTLELGYTFPKALVNKARLQNLRVYTAMDNLFTITGYTGYTPDLGFNDGDGANGSGSGVMSRGCDDGRYPLARTITFGVQLSF